MIIGIGTDIIEISRIKNLLENTFFTEKCFTTAEIEYAKNSPQSFAVMYAAKEAYSKALGTGIRGFSLKDVEVLHDELSKPYIIAHNKAKLSDAKIFVSLSHSKENAIAYVVIEKE